QAVGRYPEIAPRYGPPLRPPEGGIFGAPINEHTGARRRQYAGLTEATHLGKLRQGLRLVATKGCPLHLPYGNVHPDKRDGYKQKEESETRRPDPCQVEQHAEHERQDETAETADHPDKAADSADMLGIVDGDVLEDRRVAEAHEEAKHGDHENKGNQPHGG